MKLMLNCVTACVVSLILTGCQSAGYNSEVKEILSKMVKAYDPNDVLANYQSEVLVGIGKDIGRKSEAKIVMKFKKPNKMRVDLTIPGKEAVVRAYDGKTGWQYSSKSGYRQMTGDELDEMRFRADFYSPNARLSEIFKSIKLKGIVDVAGNKSYELLCLPLDKYNSEPITICVDQQTHFINKIIEQQDTQNEELRTITYLTNTKEFDGIYFPATMISDISGEIKELNIKSIELNVDMDDADFDPPEKLTE